MLSAAKRKANICWQNIRINMLYVVNMMESSENACKYRRTKSKQCRRNQANPANKARVNTRRKKIDNFQFICRLFAVASHNIINNTNI